MKLTGTGRNLVRQRVVSPLALSQPGLRPLKQRWQYVLGETRTRILLWYILILGLVFLAGIPAFRYLLFQRVNGRIQDNLAEEREHFRRMIADESYFLETLKEHNPENYEELQEYVLRTQSQVVPPASLEDLEEFFDRYLRQNVLEEHTFLITFLDGKFYKSSPRGRPKPLQRNSTLMNWWARQTQPSQGRERVSAADGGDLIYQVEPIFVIAQLG